MIKKNNDSLQKENQYFYIFSFIHIAIWLLNIIFYVTAYLHTWKFEV